MAELFLDILFECPLFALWIVLNLGIFVYLAYLIILHIFGQ